MKQSLRAKRMARNHERRSKQTKLSLVSLMDIFTILVFFLMFNSSDVQVLDNHKSVTLPKSAATTPAKETLLVMVNGEDLLLQGQKLASVPALLTSGSDIIAPLAKELDYQNSKSQQPAQTPRSITIMGDAEIPYQLLKRILQTCSQAGYTDVALAVEQSSAVAAGVGQ
ncbi:biopolymer transporter ExbD [Alteromonas aestuariivivens]|uniref:Biopolymer transporter ExbD n=1 Tax=Alteromonas aestuariivivens TaxID=1938339 RepID=A0A3D8MCE6_9ALTE|nr:biopolymer transporter ExbD [Alteromonas aestuariivivens]RDV28188.1 biopolymer transporter ExbD [Alteromonas aestuariivivens]